MLTLNRDAYQKLIDEDIEIMALLKGVFVAIERRLEWDHIVAVLEGSPERAYDEPRRARRLIERARRYLSPKRHANTCREIALWVAEQDGRDPQGAEVDGTLECSIYDFARSCQFHIAEEQTKANPDNMLIGVLCNGVRMAREYGRSGGRPRLSVPDAEKGVVDG